MRTDFTIGTILNSIKSCNDIESDPESDPESDKDDDDDNVTKHETLQPEAELVTTPVAKALKADEKETKQQKCEQKPRNGLMSSFMASFKSFGKNQSVGLSPDPTYM